MRSKHLKALLGPKTARKLECLEKLQGLRSHGGIRRTLKALIEAEYWAATENFGQTHLIYPKTNPVQRTNPDLANILRMLKRGDKIAREKGLLPAFEGEGVSPHARKIPKFRFWKKNTAPR